MLWIALWSLVGFGGTRGAPLLLDEPVLLMLLSPRAVFCALAAPRLDMWAFVLLGTVRLSVTDASYFVCGRRAPSAAGARVSRKAPGFVRLRTWGKRLGDLIHERPVLASAVLFARPSGRHLAIAGACGVSCLQASLSAVLGTIAYLALIHQGLALL